MKALLQPRKHPSPIAMVPTPALMVLSCPDYNIMSPSPHLLVDSRPLISTNINRHLVTSSQNIRGIRRSTVKTLRLLGLFGRGHFLWWGESGTVHSHLICSL